MIALGREPVLLLSVVARSRLDRYEELRRHFEGRRTVRIILDLVRESVGGLITRFRD